MCVHVYNVYVCVVHVLCVCVRVCVCVCVCVTLLHMGTCTRAHTHTTHPVATSHIFMDLSRDADTRKSPEGMKQMEETLWSWPCSVLMQSYVEVKSHNRTDMSAEHDAKKKTTSDEWKDINRVKHNSLSQDKTIDHLCCSLTKCLTKCK